MYERLILADEEMMRPVDNEVSRLWPSTRACVGTAAVVTLLAGCWFHSGSQQLVLEPVERPVATGSRSDWTDGLDWAANGPVPTMVVDQFGYRTEAQKVAVLRRPVTGYDAGSTYTPGGEIQVVDADSGRSVFSASAVAWHRGAQDAVSGDMAWWFDFSEVTEPGRYYVADPENRTRSAEFTIDDAVYRDVLKQAVRTFFYQRAGQEKTADLAGPSWADDASHLGPRQDGESLAWLGKDDTSTRRDLRGGWYDAGDYNKYTAWHASYVLGLLHTYAEHPELVGDDLRIPESGNGVSDLLDEIVWGLDWLIRMQEPDGSVLCVQALDAASPPSAAAGPSYYGPATTNASLKASAAFAFAATVFASSGVPTLAARSADLTRRANSAWEWAAANPTVTYYNNDETRQPGSGGLAAGQQEPDERGRAASRLEAAVYLYGQTQARQFRNHVEGDYQAVLPDGSQTQWTVNEQETLLHYASLPGVTTEVSKRIKDSFLRALTSGPLFLNTVHDEVDPYRAPIEEYTWGSNQSKARMGRMLALASVHGLDKRLSDHVRSGGLPLAAAEGYVHYLHGVNPLGMVYLTNMQAAGAEHSASTLYHSWFADGSRWDSVTVDTPGPAPGFLVGGPNPHYSLDPCCAETPGCATGDAAGLCRSELSPPLGQPAMKSYLQFNEGWPANSWEVTENSNGYQVAYIRLLATFAE